MLGTADRFRRVEVTATLGSASSKMRVMESELVSSKLYDSFLYGVSQIERSNENRYAYDPDHINATRMPMSRTVKVVAFVT
jgi:hypothetical protein